MSVALSEAAEDVLDSLRSLRTATVPQLQEDTGRSRAQVAKALVELESAFLAIGTRRPGGAGMVWEPVESAAPTTGAAREDRTIEPSPAAPAESPVGEPSAGSVAESAQPLATACVDQEAHGRTAAVGAAGTGRGQQPPSDSWTGRGGRHRGAPRRQAAAYVREHPGCVVTEVARGLGVSDLAANHALVRARKAGLVERSGVVRPTERFRGASYRWWPPGGSWAAGVEAIPLDEAGESNQRVEAGPVAGATGEGAPSTWAAEVEAEAGATTSTATEAPPVPPAVLEEARRALDEDCDDGCPHQRIAPLPRNAYGDVDGRCLDCGEGFPLEVQGPYDPDDDSRGGEALRRVALVERLLLRDLPAHVRDESFEVRVAYLAGRLGDG